jgi:hypothetical protein
VKDAGESVLSPDVEVIQSAGIGDRLRSWAQWCCCVQGAVGAVPVVEQLELMQGMHQVSVVPDQGAVQELAPAGLYPPLHDRIHPGCADRARDDLDAFAGEHGVERLGEFGVAVADHVLRRGAGVLEVHHQVPRDLGDPSLSGVGGDTKDPDAATGVFDDGEHVVGGTGQRGGGEEVAGEDGLGLAAQERGPGGVVTVRGGLDPMPFQDLPDGGGRDRDPEAGEFAVDATVTPGVVLATDPPATCTWRPSG